METLNVTEIEPRLKHPTIFEWFDGLQPGEGFVINNDHDPVPLYYQMLAERGEVFDWEYLEKGPENWKVRISKLKDDQQPSIGELVAADYRKAEVFKKFGLDFCCGGKKKVDEACAKKGVDPNAVKKELKELDDENEQGAPSQDPLNWSATYLVDHIVGTHHEYVKNSIPYLQQLLTKVRKVHGDRNPELHRIADIFFETAQELELHMRKEEEILFPHIKELEEGRTEREKPCSNFNSVEDPIQVMEEEHDLAGRNFEKIEELSNGFQPPEGACMSYQVTFKKLEEFQNDLHRHVHLENNILFPKAKELEKEKK